MDSSIFFKKAVFGKHDENIRIGQFDLLEMAWHQPQTSIRNLMQRSCGRIMQFTMQGFKIHNRLYSNISFLYFA